MIKKSAYRTQTKGLRWFHKVLWYLMDICVLNAFIMYNASRDPESRLLLREFREQLATKLIGGRSYRKASDYVRQDDEKRLNHMFSHVPKKMDTSVNCKVHMQRCETIYICGECGIRIIPVSTS